MDYFKCTSISNLQYFCVCVCNLSFCIIETPSNRNMKMEVKPKSRLNLNGALELIQEDKHTENGKSMKETKKEN